PSSAGRSCRRSGGRTTPPCSTPSSARPPGSSSSTASPSASAGCYEVEGSRSRGRRSAESGTTFGLRLPDLRPPMRIVRHALHPYRLPLREPVTLGRVRIEEREGVLLRLEAEGGAVGWGDAAPLQIGRAHVWTPVTLKIRMPSSALK